MTKLLRRYLCAVAIVISLSACGQNRYVPNPDAQVIRELSGTRIVMLADYGHELSAPYRNLIATLSTWLTMV
jgi:predicted small lipoprotein YifL